MTTTESWINPALYIRQTQEKNGMGVFSNTDLPSGECIGRPAGGAIYTTDEVKVIVPKWGDYFHQIDDSHHWGPRDAGDMDLLDIMNHSCDPTAWWDGDMRMVTRREVRAHEDELTWPYETTESYEGYGFKCHCGTAQCRGRMDGDDWKDLGLQIRYAGHFQSYLQRKIETTWKENHIWVKNGKLYYIDDYDPFTPHWHEVIGGERGVIVNRRSKFQHIQIIETKYGRMLVLDGYPQLAERDHFAYREALALPALLWHPHPRRVRLFGAGDGHVLSFLLNDPRIEEATIIEIDPEVTLATQQEMPSLWEPALPHIASGRAKIRNANVLDILDSETDQADIIFWDLTDPEEGNLATPLMNVECFRKAKRFLGPGGILAMQAGEKAPLFSGGHDQAHAIVREVFPYVTSGSVFIGSFSTPWGFLFASQEPLPPLGSQMVVRRLFDKHQELISTLKYMNSERLAAMFA